MGLCTAFVSMQTVVETSAYLATKQPLPENIFLTVIHSVIRLVTCLVIMFGALESKKP